MNWRRLRVVYAAGVVFNAAALVAAATAGETLFAVAFGFLVVYLAVRFWMVSKGIGTPD